MSTKVRFVIRGSSQQDLMLKAAQAVQNARLPTEKFSVGDVLKLDKKDRHLYVCGQFSGDAFDHLVSVNCRVVGPQCVISCLELQVAVPNVAHPINNIAMQDVVVSCSSVEKARRETLHQLIQWMGGRVSRDFTEIVTHLVVGEVGSKKYHVAANLKKPIMLPEWIEAAWEESQSKHFSGTTSEFIEQHRCPSFQGCIICVTGLESTQRRDVKRMAEQYGGHYTGELKYNECTHLIVGVSRGPKFEFARKWSIHSVSIQWFYDSIEAGYCLDEQLYSVQSQDQPTSTPVKQQQHRLSTLSNISAINMSTIHPVDETAVTEPSISMETGTTPRGHQPKCDLEELEKFDLNVYRAEMFLDGCKIFLSGFTGQHLEKLRRIVNTGGGTRFNQVNENVSHVILGGRVDEHLEEIKTLPNRPIIVSFRWLIECVKAGRQVPEEDFVLKIFGDGEDKENEVTFKPPEQHPRKTSRSGARKPSDEKTEEDILSQYRPSASTADDDNTTMIQEEKPGTSESAGSRSRDDDETQIEEDKPEDGGEEEDDEDEDEEGVEEAETEGQMGTGDGIFAGKKFVVLGFPEEQEVEFHKMIPAQSGVVLPGSTRSIPDYAVVPIFGWPVNITASEIVTNCWLQMCIDKESMLDLSSNVLFTPIALVKDAQPLEDCVLSISQYCYVERDCLLHIAELLGARCQEYFVKKAVKNHEANTHLLLRDPEGTKYLAALKWKVPAITKEWLLACATTGKRQPEKDYLVHLKHGETAAKAEENAVVTGLVKKNDFVRQCSRTDQESLKEIKEKETTERSGLVERNAEINDCKASVSTEVPPEQFTAPAQPLRKKALQGVKGQTPGRECTPSRLLRPGFKPSFDLEEAVAALESPGVPSVVSGDRRRKSSLPLDEFFHQNIANALQIRLGNGAGTCVGEDAMEDGVFRDEEQQPAPGILDGVVICVSKKLSRKQSDYNVIAMAMGAEYAWTYDENCTHFIFQGKANDMTKEFRQAKNQGKIIVSPHWLLACREENRRVDEALYPHTYNPKLSLSVVASRGQTPSRPALTKAPVSMASPTVAAPPPAAEEAAAVEGFQEESVTDEELERAVVPEEQVRRPDVAVAKEDLQKQLNEIMLSTMNLRGNRRRSRRPGCNLSTGGDSTSGSDSNTNGRRSTRIRSKRSAEKGQPEDLAKEIGLHSEASQSVQITWDDPTSRREKEKIMAQLKRADNAHTDPEEQGEDGPLMEELAAKESHTSTSNTAASEARPEPEDSPPTPTPKAPPIRLPLARPAVAPQPKDGTREQLEHETSSKPLTPRPKFLFTGMGQQEKIDYSALIEQLGGEVKDAQYFDATCSHIIVGNPSRNEKYLAALATGKWILHKSYLEACREARGFVEEDPHEWGPRTDLSKLSEMGKKMALAATRWRMRLCGRKNEGGAFAGWQVFLLVEKSKEMCFKRLLEAGGARVLAVRPPFSSQQEASHAFFDLHKVKVDVDAVALEELVHSGVLCIKPEYIADFLVHDPSPDPQNYIISEAKPIVQRLAAQAGQCAGSKRRAQEMPLTPRSKRTKHR